MKKKINNPSAPKKVSADNKTSKNEVNTNSFALPFEPKTLDIIREAVWVRKDTEPNDIFMVLLGDKDICPRPMLKEMFGINNDYLFRRVFFEGRRKGDRAFNDDPFARQVLRLTMDRDGKPLQFTPAQVKLRELLARRLDWYAYDNLMFDFEEAYGLHYEDYFNFGDSVEIMEKCNISEEELLDALQTYQAEHQA